MTNYCSKSYKFPKNTNWIPTRIPTLQQKHHRTGTLRRTYISLLHFFHSFFLFSVNLRKQDLFESDEGMMAVKYYSLPYTTLRLLHTRPGHPAVYCFFWDNKTIDNLWWLSIGLEWQLFASTLPDFIIFYSLPPNNFGTLPMAASIMLHLKLSEIYNSIVHSLNIVSECTLTYSRLQHTGNDDI